MDLAVLLLAILKFKSPIIGMTIRHNLISAGTILNGLFAKIVKLNTCKQ